MNTISLRPPANDLGNCWTFFRYLQESRLLPAEKVEELRRRFIDQDQATVAAALVEEEWLTPYQVNRIMEGEYRGLVLGQYAILDELGQGGFGKVYKAVHGIMDRVVALKVIAPQLVEDPGIRDLFLREAVATTRMVHPNIAMAYDANEIDNVLFLAMEFVDGPNLEKLVADRGPLPILFVCWVIHQVAQALQYAHDKGMVHRDIKPANLLLAGAGSALQATGLHCGFPPAFVKVVDFGFARLYPQGTPQSCTILKDCLFLGTPEFISPEQAQDFHRVDIRSDLYSLGCTFYFALTGQLPFEGSTAMETIAMHLDREPPSLVNLRPEVPLEVASIVRRLLAKKPERRFQVPADLVEALNIALRNLWQAADVPPSGCPRKSPVATVKEQEHSRTVALSGDGGKGIDTRETLANNPELPLMPSEMNPNALGSPPEPAQGRVLVLWKEWLALVDTLAWAKPPQWNEREYKVLHRSLLEALANHPVLPTSEGAQLGDRLRSLVEPWVTLRTILDLDRKTLIGLWRTCQELTQELAPASPIPFRAWIIPIGLLAGVFLFGFYILWHQILVNK